MARAERVEKERRIYQVGLMLRRKPVSFIVDFAGREWQLQRSQAYEYIKAARVEWRKYFEKLKGDGISYHAAQLRDLKDQAYSKKIVIGKGEDRKEITIADLGLIFEISKEEAKLMGIYPSEKHTVDLKGELKLYDAKQKLISEIDRLTTKGTTGQDNIEDDQ